MAHYKYVAPVHYTTLLLPIIINTTTTTIIIKIIVIIIIYLNIQSEHNLSHIKHQHLIRY